MKGATWLSIRTKARLGSDHIRKRAIHLEGRLGRKTSPTSLMRRLKRNLILSIRSSILRLRMWSITMRRMRLPPIVNAWSAWLCLVASVHA
jgi:hypothetical protein